MSGIINGQATCLFMSVSPNKSCLESLQGHFLELMLFEEVDHIK